MGLLRGFHDLRNGAGQAAPVPGFGFELFPALPGERIILGVAAGFGFAPLGREPAALFEAVQGGIERALLHLEDVARDLLNRRTV